jgi:hypothetical protein
VQHLVRLQRTALAERDAVRRMRQDLAAAPAAERQARLAQEAFRHMPMELLAGREEGEALASFSSGAESAAARSRARILAVSPLLDSLHAGKLRRIRVQLDLESDLAGLVAALRRIEAQPGVVVQSLGMTAAARGSEDPATEALRARVVVSGWYLARPAAGGAP